jgi:hypothetical protein
MKTPQGLCDKLWPDFQIALVDLDLRANHEDPLKSKANLADIIRLTIAVAQMVYTGC